MPVALVYEACGAKGQLQSKESLPMLKRPHNHAFSEPPSEGNITPLHRHATPEDFSISLVRMIITRESRLLKTRKDHINTILKEHGLKSGTKLSDSRTAADMRDIFGLTVQFEKTNMEASSSLVQESRDLIKDLLRPGNDKSLTVKNQLLPAFFLPSDLALDGCLDNLLLISGGLLLLIVCIIVVSEDNIPETSLLRELHKFGIARNQNLLVPNLNCDILTILQEFVKKEYLRKSALEDQDHHTNENYYGIGSRTLQTFGLQELKDVLSKMLGSHEDWSSKIDVCLGRCFPTP